jgi:RND family efflux transporter MFP subunit
MHTHQKGEANIVRSLPIDKDPHPTGADRQTAIGRLYTKPMLTGVRRRISFLLLKILLLSSVISFVAVAASPGSGSALPPLVTVAPVTIQDINPPTEYIGHVEAIQAVDLRARVDGFLEQINFQEGEKVPSGKLLFAIEQAPYLAQVAVDKAQVAQAEVELTRANQHLKRLRSALSASVPAMDLDDAVAAQMHAEAQIAMAQATLNRSLLNLSYTTIKAPISGRIGRTAYTRGNVVGPTSNPLARIVQVDPIRVVYSISDNNLAAIQMAMNDALDGQQSPALVPRIRLANGTILDTAGRIDFVDNEMDPATGTIAIRAEFDNPKGHLIPGQYVSVLVTLTEPKLLPVVPQAAVLVNQQGRYVLVVDSENIARVRPIVIGQAVGLMWAVESGLKADELVIVEGIQKVKPDAAVQISPSGAQES